jgi:hypothetical protein
MQTEAVAQADGQVRDPEQENHSFFKECQIWGRTHNSRSIGAAKEDPVSHTDRD